MHRNTGAHTVETHNWVRETHTGMCRHYLLTVETHLDTQMNTWRNTDKKLCNTRTIINTSSKFNIQGNTT